MGAAKSRGRHAAGRSASKPAGIITDPADAQSWLYLNPLGPSHSGTVFGVLRKTYADREKNTAVAFGSKKMAPVAPPQGAAAPSSPITAERVDVVLPPGAPDELSDPLCLLQAMDACAIDKALLVYVTLSFRATTRLHHAWEEARAFAATICRERNLAVLVILHAPGRVGSPNPPHAHLLIGPRTVGTLGMAMGTYDRELTTDQGQSLIEALWSKRVSKSDQE